MDIEEAQKLLARPVAKRRGWREAAREDFAFTAGHQWSEEDAAQMDEAIRPRITFNTIAPVADAIAGQEVSNRQEVSYLPRQTGASGVNEVQTAAAEWVREESDAEHEESEAFYDATVSGEGWTGTELDYETDLDGLIEIARVAPPGDGRGPLEHAQELRGCKVGVPLQGVLQGRCPGTLAGGGVRGAGRLAGSGYPGGRDRRRLL